LDNQKIRITVRSLVRLFVVAFVTVGRLQAALIATGGHYWEMMALK
jgi:hypothetical protein